MEEMKAKTLDFQLLYVFIYYSWEFTFNDRLKSMLTKQHVQKIQDNSTEQLVS